MKSLPWNCYNWITRGICDQLDSWSLGVSWNERHRQFMFIEIRGHTMINQWMEWVSSFQSHHIMGISWNLCAKRLRWSKGIVSCFGFCCFRGWIAELTACRCIARKFGAGEMISCRSRSWSHFSPFLVQNASFCLYHLDGRSPVLLLTGTHCVADHSRVASVWGHTVSCCAKVWDCPESGAGREEPWGHLLLSWAKLATCGGGGLM